MKKVAFLCSIFIFLAFLFPGVLLSQDVKIGVIYPMSGPTAQIGLDHKHAIELALDIINTTKYKHLNLPLSKAKGLTI